MAPKQSERLNARQHVLHLLPVKRLATYTAVLTQILNPLDKGLPDLLGKVTVKVPHPDKHAVIFSEKELFWQIYGPIPEIYESPGD